MPFPQIAPDDAEFLASLSDSELRRRLTQRGVYIEVANLLIARRDDDESLWTIADTLGYAVD
jgi:hypothetical protein